MEPSQPFGRSSTKTARYLHLIIRQRLLENITFKMNLVSRLAAADYASGVAGNIDISEHTCTMIYHQQTQITWMYWKSSSQKTARYFPKILHHIVEHNISFQMNLVSRLAAAVCAPGNHLNFNIAKHSDTVISHHNYKYDFSLRHLTQKRLVICA